MKYDAEKIMKDLDFASLKKNNLDYEKYFQRTNDFLEIMDKVGKEKKTLDIGIGQGWHAKITSHVYNCDVTGIGLEEDERMKSNYDDENIKFIEHDITKHPLPFENNDFDLVIFSEVLEHLLCQHPPYFLFDEIYRVLKDDGFFIFTTPNHSNIRKRFSILQGNNPSLWVMNGKRTYIDHIREYNLSELKYILKLTGFEITYQKFSNQRPSEKTCKQKLFSLPFKFLEKIEPSFRNTIIILARKSI